MSMTKQPPGLTRSRRGEVKRGEPTERHPEGKPLPPEGFEIHWKDPDAGRVKVGETERVGKRWRPVSPHAPSPEPMARHGDAMAWLLEQHKAHAHARHAEPEQVTSPPQPPEQEAPEAATPAHRQDGGSFAEAESVRVVPEPVPVPPAPPLAPPAPHPGDWPPIPPAPPQARMLPDLADPFGDDAFPVA